MEFLECLYVLYNVWNFKLTLLDVFFKFFIEAQKLNFFQFFNSILLIEF